MFAIITVFIVFIYFIIAVVSAENDYFISPKIMAIIGIICIMLIFILASIDIYF